jgi:hypothetical protein
MGNPGRENNKRNISNNNDQEFSLIDLKAK